MDGEPVVFDLLTEGRAWVARAERDALVITLTGRDLPPAQVELARVTDIDGYHPGPAGG